MSRRSLIIGAAAILLIILFRPAGAQPPPPTHQVVINEIAWMGTQASYADEWIELYNNTDSSIDIGNWSIFGADTGQCLNFSAADGDTIIPANGYLIYANHRDDVKDSDDESMVDIRDATIELNNNDSSPGQLILYDAPGCADGHEIDIANQTVDGWFAGDNDSKSTMERIDPTASGTDGGNWGTYNGTTQYAKDADGNYINGTPKQWNSVAPTPTPTLTSTPSLTPTSTNTPTTTPTATSTSTPTFTPTLTPTSTWTPTTTPTATATSTSSPSATLTPTSTWTPTATPSATATSTPSTTPSPSPSPTLAPAGDVVINEIAWMGTQASYADEWIEVYNNTNSAVDLTGWGIYEDGGATLIEPLTGIIEPNTYFLVERSDDHTVDDVEADQTPTGWSGYGLSDDGEHLQLKDDVGNVIDEVDCSSGWFAGDKGSHASMERIDPTASGSDSGNWDTNDGSVRYGHDAGGYLINGTPKQVNSVAVIPTPTLTSTPSLTPTSTTTPTSTPTGTLTSTPSSTPTVTPTSTWTPTTTPTATATSTSSPTASFTPTIPVTPTPSSTPTFTPTSTRTPTPTSVPARRVVINELAWAGTAASASDEWIELYNTAGHAFDLTGWRLGADDGTPDIALSGTIPAHGYFLLERTADDTVGDIPADQIYTGSLSNSGEMLTLRDPTGTVVDTANGDGGGWPAGAASGTTPAYACMERIDPAAPDSDSNWATNDGATRNGLDAGGNPINGTPKQINAATLRLTITPTPSSTASPTPTPTRTATPTHTTTDTPTARATSTFTTTPTSTRTPTPTATQTPAAPGSVLINEVVTDPQQDWNDSRGGNGVPFDATPGTGTITPTDEWLELLNVSGAAIDLSRWTLEMIDTTPASLAFSDPGTTVFRFSQGGSIRNFKPGERLIIGNPPGTMNNDVLLVLRQTGQTSEVSSAGPGAPTQQRSRKGQSATGSAKTWEVSSAIIDDLEIGFDPEGDGDDGAPAPGENGNATGPDDEAVARVPDGVDTDNDVANFAKQPASVGYSNDAAPPTPTPTPTATPTPTPTPAQKGAVLINEVVTDPQQDWNDTAGGDGVAFNDVPGSGKITSTDEWLELLNPAQHSLDLTGWSLIMTDSTPATQVLGEGTAIVRFSAGSSLTDFRPGGRLVIGNPKGALNNDIYVELRDASGHLIDDVEIGDDFEEDGRDGAPGVEQNGNALTTYDEAIARVPDGWDSGDDRADFEKWPATIGTDNGRPHRGHVAQLPVLNTADGAAECSALIDIQNVAATSTQAVILFWEDAGHCPPQCAGPSGVSCTGLLKPGASWHLDPAQIPSGARAGAVFSAFSQTHAAFEEGGDVLADALCEALFNQVVADCGEYRRFRRAFDQRGVWDAGRGYPDFDFAAFPSQSIAVEVTRRCQDGTGPGVTGAYLGIQGRQLGRLDPQFGGFAYYAPLVYADWRGFDSVLHIQNAGLACTSVELWFRRQEACQRAQVCTIPAVAPGESYRLDASDCVGPNWVGNVWLRTSQPAAVVVNTAGHGGLLMTHQAMPAELNDTLKGGPRKGGPPSRDQPADPLFTCGSQVNYGPLIYREHQGWDTRIQVQNLSSVLNAKVKVYFLDAYGDIIHTVVDWICPRGSQSFTLAAIGHLPGNWVGQVRVESQDWFAPGSAAVSAPNIVGVAQLMRWSGPAQTTPLAAMSYNLLSEQQILNRSTSPGPCRGIGWDTGDSRTGTGLISLPSLSSGILGRSKGGSPGMLGAVSQLAIQNAVDAPGFTEFVVWLYDQNGLLDYVCEELSARQVTYVNLADWGYINWGFKGSAVISAVAWDHPAFGSTAHGAERNLLGLAAVEVERPVTPALSGNGVAGDRASANVGLPLAGPFRPFSSAPELGFEEGRPICPP